MEVVFCQCGRVIKDGKCKKCGKKAIPWSQRPIPRQRIGKWSGPTKRMKGAYEKD